VIEKATAVRKRTAEAISITNVFVACAHKASTITYPARSLTDA